VRYKTKEGDWTEGRKEEEGGKEKGERRRKERKGRRYSIMDLYNIMQFWKRSHHQCVTHG